jgi:hypothetical protein
MNVNLTGMGRINRIKTWSANVCASRKDLLICLYYFRAFGVFRGKNVLVFVTITLNTYPPVTSAETGKHLAPVIIHRATGDATAGGICELEIFISFFFIFFCCF